MSTTTASAEDAQPPLLGRITLALLDRRRRLDYLLLAVMGGLPSVIAWHIGLDRTLVVDGVTWVGFFDRQNFWPQVVLLPAFVFLVRWTFGRLADVASATTPNPPPPVIRLFRPGADQAIAYQRLRAVYASGRLLAVVLAVVVLVMALDMASIAATYSSNDPASVLEHDWSLMYLSGAATRTENLVLLASAYTVQATLFVFRFLAITGILVHNLFYLRHIWQRRRAAADPDRPLIRLRLDDRERCLGMRPASEAFNTQVILFLFGAGMTLLSRYAHITEDVGLAWSDLNRWPPLMPAAAHLPDAGQWILAISWISALTMITLPTMLKLQPLFGSRGPELTLTEFLREFLPDGPDGVPPKPTTAQLDQLAARFANQAYWPGGDNRAGVLFMFGAMVILVVLYPVSIQETSLLIAMGVLLAVVSWLLSRLAFSLLAVPLRFVDARLVTAAPELLPAQPTTELISDLGVFISYRRSDSRAYARLIHNALAERFDPQRVFMDISTLRDGEDFVAGIDRAVKASDIMLVVIGPDWLAATDASGQRRLEDPDDLVAHEIKLALNAGLRIIPVLVGDATMMGEDDLPEGLKPLWRRQARALDDGHWDYDLTRLIDAMMEPAASADEILL